MIEIKGLHKQFGDNKVLDGVDVSVAAGEVVVILGASGSGKTTLLRCINFLEQADKGSIEVDGVSVSLPKKDKKKELEIRRKTALVFQNYNLFQNKTVIENVMEALIVVKKLKKPEAERIAVEMLEKVNMLDKRDVYPSSLSGGQQQRVGIARALAIKPEVILFDEPTSALDPELVGEVLDVMRAIAHTGIAMIVVTHERSFAYDIADRVIFMNEGNIVEQGEPHKVFAAPENEFTKKFLNCLRRDAELKKIS